MPMQHPSESSNDVLADTIRRTIRVLGAQPSPVTDPSAVVSAARLVFERLLRAGIPARWIDDNPDAPLVVAGQGPIGITTYLDDSHPDSTQESDTPPSFDRGMVRAPGIERKAGVVAALATLLAFPERSKDLTVIIETDRHAGSISIEQWLEREQPDLSAIVWEVADIPLIPPVVARAATGRLVVQIELRTARQQVEHVYGGVLPDVGLALANTLATLKTADEEVRLNGFYDGIISPDEADFEALLAVAPEIAGWLQRVAKGHQSLSTSHMTLGTFCAPSVVVRDINITHNAPYLPNSASAVIEFQLMPGQSIERTLETLQTHVQNSLFATTVTPLLARAPSLASNARQLSMEATTLPLAPGPSPAALFATLGIACVGYAVVGRRSASKGEGVSLESIANGVHFLFALAESLAAPKATVPR